MEAVVWRCSSNRCSLKFRKFHRKTPGLESLFNKVASPQACNLIKKRLQHRCFPMKYAKFLRTPFLQKTSGGCFFIHKEKLRHAKTFLEIFSKLIIYTIHIDLDYLIKSTLWNRLKCCSELSLSLVYWFVYCILEIFWKSNNR